MNFSGIFFGPDLKASASLDPVFHRPSLGDSATLARSLEKMVFTSEMPHIGRMELRPNWRDYRDFSTVLPMRSTIWARLQAGPQQACLATLMGVFFHSMPSFGTK